MNDPNGHAQRDGTADFGNSGDLVQKVYWDVHSITFDQIEVFTTVSGHQNTLF